MGVRVFVLLLTIVAGASAVGQEPDWYHVHPDSLLAPGRQAEPVRLPTNKLFYLEQKHGLCPSRRRTDEPESLNVRMVGKWGGGPSWGVTGRDTLVYLSRGSEVVVVNFADTANPEVLNHIQARRLAGRPVLQDSLLYLATSGYVEVFDVSDPTNAPRVGRLSVPVAGIDVEDSLVYVVGADSFMVWSFADPGSPQMLGACLDSGIAVDVENGYAYLCDRWGLYVLDVRDPADPHRVASWGTHVNAVRVRGNHCYVLTGSTGGNSLFILNVSVPSSPWQEGSLGGVTGEGLYLVDTLLFTCEFDIVNIADSSDPSLVAHLAMPQDRHAVWADEDLNRALVAANYAGMLAIDLRDLGNPVTDTVMLSMGDAVEVSVGGSVACVAARSGTGLTLLDVADPTCMREVANLDTAGGGPGCRSVVNAESLAYLSWWGLGSPRIRVVDIVPPESACFVGEAESFNPAEAIALRDSFLYCAEDSKFEVFSVADPRQPVWRGRCNSLDMVLCGLDVVGQYAYEIAGPFGLAVISIADPTNPYVVSTTTGHPTYAAGVAVRDTFAFVPSAYDTLWVHSIANPAGPRVVGCAPIDDGGGYDICLRDSYAFLGCVDFHVFDISTPAQPVRAGYHESPYRAFDVTCDSSYIYVASYLAGVAVYEMLPSGLEERGRGMYAPAGASMRITPNPASGSAQLCWDGLAGPARVVVFDASGRVVMEQECEFSRGTTLLPLDPSHVKSGVYFVGAVSGSRVASGKFVKQ